MTDTERIDFLENLLWSNRIGNGLALFPATAGDKKIIDILDLADEDGSNLGKILVDADLTLREAIDGLSGIKEDKP